MDDLPVDQAQPPARDLDLAVSAAGGDRALAAELFASLLEALPGDLTALRTAYDANAWRTLADQAHRLRGATRYCGVPRLDAATEALERTAADGVAEHILGRLVHLEEEAHRLRDEHVATDR
jgi:two-component system sensor histidine kinase BarA